MRIFITGGTGFIGPYIVEQLLKDKHDLLLLSYEKEEPSEKFLEVYDSLKLVSGDLLDISAWKQYLEDFSPESVIHMAWQGIPNYKARTSVRNLQNSLNFFLTLAEIGCKQVLTTGSCWEYGRTEGKLSEEMPPRPHNPFSAAKNALRIMGEEIAKENGMQFIWTRFFYVYGPGQKTSSLLPYIINSVLKREKPTVKTPNSKNDFIFVEDVAAAVTMIVKNCKRDQAIYNIGSGYSTSVRKLMEIVYEKSKTSLPNDIFAKKQSTSDIVDFWADISRIKKEIGWKPKVSIDQGIAKMLDHYRLETSKK
ncbi:MAG: NAD-dependent epimerase/dehydratase family protein [Candidatus Odinarchaeota archaeon]